MSIAQPSLRDHLKALEDQELLFRITKPVNPKYEAAALIKQAAKLKKAILFEKILASDHQAVANVVGSREMISIGLGLSSTDLLPELSNRIRSEFKTRLVKTGPVQEEVSDDPDLSKIPILSYFERDAAPYITAGTVVAKDPDSGFRNASFNRMMLKSSGKLGIRMMPPQHLGIIQSKSESKERQLDVAVVLGNHPAEMLASASTLPFGVDHLDYAGRLRGERLETVKCKTVDLEVPANAELVIEGEIEARVREEEGPFGEFMDYYVEKGSNHVLKVKSITHRSDYIFQALLCGSPEDLSILALSREMAVYTALKSGDFDVTDVSLMPFIFNAAFSMKKRFDGEPKNALLAAFGAYSWLKYCVAVDDDVNVQDLADVWWALATRSDPDRGLVHISEAMGFPRKDKLEIHRGKLGVDATVPMARREEFQRKKIPESEKVVLENYL